MAVKMREDTLAERASEVSSIAQRAWMQKHVLAVIDESHVCHPATCKVERITGNVYGCTTSGKMHTCDAISCPHIWVNKDSSRVCPLTGLVFGQSMQSAVWQVVEQGCPESPGAGSRKRRGGASKADGEMGLAVGRKGGHHSKHNRWSVAEKGHYDTYEGGDDACGDGSGNDSDGGGYGSDGGRGGIGCSYLNSAEDSPGLRWHGLGDGDGHAGDEADPSTAGLEHAHGLLIRKGDTPQTRQDPQAARAAPGARVKKQQHRNSHQITPEMRRKAETIIRSLLFGTKKEALSAKREVQMRRHFSRLMKQYIRARHELRVRPNLISLLEIQLFCMQGSGKSDEDAQGGDRSTPNTSPQDVSVQTLDYYVTAVSQLWGIILSTPYAAGNSRRFVWEAHVVASLYMMQYGLIEMGIQIIPRDAYLTSTLPGVNDMRDLRINKTWITTGNNCIKRCISSAFADPNFKKQSLQLIL